MEAWAGVSARRVVITRRAATAAALGPIRGKVSESLPETRARVMTGLSLVERAQPGRLRDDSAGNPDYLPAFDTYQFGQRV